MRRLLFFITVFVCTRMVAALPSGTFVEMHSCEVYTGGCTASAQATGDGRYMLQLWKIAQGEFHGVDLQGQPVALLRVGRENLAWAKNLSETEIVYLPATVTANTRAALLGWLRSQTDLPSTVLQRVVSFEIEKSPLGCRVALGKDIHFTTGVIHACDAGSCGEALWYQPQTVAGSFTVAMAAECQVAEPRLALRWADHAARSVFIGQFGDQPALARAAPRPGGPPIFLSPETAGALF